MTRPSSSSDNGGAADKKGTYLVCHHGAGASGLSFAPLAKHITQHSKGELGVLSYDARGHGTWACAIESRGHRLTPGKTRSTGGKERDTDLSLETLLQDLIGIITHLFPDPASAPSLLVRLVLYLKLSTVSPITTGPS